MTDPDLPFELGVVTLGNQAYEGYNNCYVLGLEDGADTTLVDTAVPDAETEAELREGLHSYGTSVAEIDRVLITHHHSDHSGLAGRIQAESGCTVHAHEADAPFVVRDPEVMDERADNLQRYLEEWDVPEAEAEELLGFLTHRDRSDFETPSVTTFEGGERFDLGNVELEAVHMPGHSAGLTGYAFEGRDGEEVFSGDALLPYYTPNVGGADTRVERPLEKYLETLAGIVERGYSRAWPGHRGPIVDPPGRAADIVAHHRDRTERVLDVLAEGPATAWEVSAELFGSLSAIHILHGPGEAYAHLDHLEDAGIVARDDDTYAYELLEPEPDLDSLFPDVGDAVSPEHQPGP